jgi:hypothetical protein
MKKAYILAFSETVGKQEQVAAVLNQMSGIISTWRYDLPNAFYLISESDAKTIATRFNELLGAKVGPRFIVSEITTNAFGWLTPESWQLIQQKEVKPQAA